jgi:hypothetical protein
MWRLVDARNASDDAQTGVGDDPGNDATIGCSIVQPTASTPAPNIIAVAA